jgi:hypothetical protein
MKALTQKKFKEYEKEICEKMDFSVSVWKMYQRDIVQFFGEYNPKVKYAGRGDSRKWTLTGWLIPEPFDNFIYYVHDGFYKLTETMPSIYGCDKEKIDLIMEEMMEIKANRPTLIPELYYRFVRWFG